MVAPNSDIFGLFFVVFDLNYNIIWRIMQVKNIGSAFERIKFCEFRLSLFVLNPYGQKAELITIYADAGRQNGDFL